MRGETVPCKPVTSTISSKKGTIRGITNRVRTNIANFHFENEKDRFQVREEMKIVIYTTSMAIIRKTYENCKRIRKILQNHMIRYEERDVSVDRTWQKELCERTNCEDVVLPQVFAGGVWLGDAEKIQAMNEEGELTQILTDYPRIERVSFSCDGCGGLRFIPCTFCGGTKKSNQGGPFQTQLKCMKCDKQGLTRCDMCAEQQE